MGRVKLQIKRIENTTNRQVTFSKRRNGLIKKAYELSVLCDVDVALLMFSPSGRLTVFSGNKSIEEVLARYVNLPEHERGRLPKQEYLQRALTKMMRTQSDTTNQVSSSSSAPIKTNSPLEEFQQQIHKYKSRIEDLEKQLSILEGDASQIKTLREADQWEQILQETLKHVGERKKVLEKKYNSPICHLPSTSQVHIRPDKAANANGFVTESPNNILDWLPQRDPQVQILNFFDANGLPLRDRSAQPVGDQMVQPPLPNSLLQGQNMNLVNEHHQSNTTNALHEDNDNNIIRHPDQFEQDAGHHVNMPSWTEFYPTGDGTIGEATHPRERALLELFMSLFTPQILTPPTRHPP